MAESLTYSLARWRQNLGEVDQPSAKVQKWEIPAADCGSSRWVRCRTAVERQACTSTPTMPLRNPQSLMLPRIVKVKPIVASAMEGKQIKATG